MGSRRFRTAISNRDGLDKVGVFNHHHLGAGETSGLGFGWFRSWFLFLLGVSPNNLFGIQSFGGARNKPNQWIQQWMARFVCFSNHGLWQGFLLVHFHGVLRVTCVICQKECFNAGSHFCHENIRNAGWRVRHFGGVIFTRSFHNPVDDLTSLLGHTLDICKADLSHVFFVLRFDQIGHQINILGQFGRFGLEISNSRRFVGNGRQFMSKHAKRFVRFRKGEGVKIFGVFIVVLGARLFDFLGIISSIHSLTSRIQGLHNDNVISSNCHSACAIMVEMHHRS
mmetsp:Transcript_28730/g.67262  ORF Transcript_28730/g.67262 Transcript_28730/m.67262 type:complete len:282 (+) Transcript_28730:1634-2479(+)